MNPTYTVYLLTNTLSGRSYVGVTKRTIARRWSLHVYDAHHGRKELKLAKAIRKYGSSCWLRSVLSVHETGGEAGDAEALWIRELQTRVTGYNIREGGYEKFRVSAATKEKMRAQALRRSPPSDVTRARMSEAGKRRPPPSAETRAKLSAASSGRHHSEAAKEKMRRKAQERVWTESMKKRSADNIRKAHAKGAWNKGVPATPEQRERLRRMSQLRGPVSLETIAKRRQKLVGRKMSPEAIEKSASTRRGMKWSEERRARARGRRMSDVQKKQLSEYRKTWRASEETKRKMSESQKRAWAEHPERYTNTLQALRNTVLSPEQRRAIGEKNRKHALERSARKKELVP